MIKLKDDLPVPFPILQVSFKVTFPTRRSTCPRLQCIGKDFFRGLQNDVMIKMMLMVVVLVIYPLQTAVVDNPLCRNDDINDIIALNYISTTLV